MPYDMKTLRRTLWTTAALIAAAAGGFAFWRGLPVSYGLSVFTLLGDSATVLFGVFGVWLGICYRDDIDTCLDGRENDALKAEARNVVARADRCELLFTGLAISALVFVMALVIRVIYPAVSEWLAQFPKAAKAVKCVFFILATESALIQIYSILTPAAIMADAIHRVRHAKANAEDTLSRF